MPLFPWRYNNCFFGNMPNMQYTPFANPQYTNGYNSFNGRAYTQDFNEMIKRNIEAEQKNENKFNEISKERKNEFSKKLEDFIKNERNSFLFYEYLRGICCDEKLRKLLKKISDDCDAAKNIYIDFYKEYFKSEVYIGKSNVDESIGFIDGVLWGIEVESDSIFKISRFISDFSLKNESINGILSRKSGRIGFLTYILFAVEKR